MKTLKLDTLDMLNQVYHAINHHLNLTSKRPSSKAEAMTVASSVANMGQPKSATITRLGTDGKTAIETIQSDYTAVQFGPKAAITGGHLSMEVHLPKEAQSKLSDSQVVFSSSGNIHLASSNIYNPDQSVARTVNSDFSKLTWNNINNIAEGEIQISSTYPSGNKISDGALTYQNQQLAKGQFSHYLKDGSTLSGQTQIDFSDNKFWGHKIAGGTTTVTEKHSNGSTASTSAINYSEQGLITTIETTNFKKDLGEIDQAIASKVTVDFAKIQFSPNRELDNGTLVIKVQNASGKPQSETKISYRNGVPSQSNTNHYNSQGELQKTSTMDYKGTHFNVDKKVVNSAVVSKTYHRDGSVHAVSQVSYDEHGHPQKSDTKTYDQQQVQSESKTDYSKAIFNHRNKIVDGLVTTTTKTKDRSIHKKYVYNGEHAAPQVEETHLGTGNSGPVNIKVIKSSTGTTELKISTTMQTDNSNVPAKTVIEYYDPSGEKVISTKTLDYSNATFDDDHEITGGYVTTQSVSEQNGATPSAEGKIQY